MNSSSKKHISLVASVLKPQDDHRVTEKWAYFLHKKLSYETHVFARKCENADLYPFLKFHDSLPTNNRLKSLVIYCKLLVQLKPNTIIITTFELLIPSFIYSLFFKTSCYYDVIENYRLNIKKQGNYNTIKRISYSAIIRLSESTSSLFIKHYFYTEKIYKQQLQFLKRNSVLIQNYYSFPFNLPLPIKPSKTIDFLITGTISKAYGIDKGIEWFNHLLNIYPNAKLTILGHKTTNYNLPIINCKNAVILLSKKPINHKQILEEIDKADYLILPYNWNESFDECTPVKLLEATFLRTKTILTKNSFLSPFSETGLTTFIEDISEIKKESNTNKTTSKIDDLSPKFSVYYDTLSTILTKY